MFYGGNQQGRKPIAGELLPKRRRGPPHDSTHAAPKSLGHRDAG